MDKKLNIENINKQKIKINLYCLVWLVIFSLLLIIIAIINMNMANDLFFGILVFIVVSFITGPVFFSIEYLIFKASKGEEIEKADLLNPLTIYFNKKYCGLFKVTKCFVISFLYFFILALVFELVLFLCKYPSVHDFGYYISLSLKDSTELPIIKYYYLLAYLISFGTYLGNVFMNTPACLLCLSTSLNASVCKKINDKVLKKHYRIIVFGFIKKHFWAFILFYFGYFIGIFISYFSKISFCLSVGICCSIAVIILYPLICDIFISSNVFFFKNENLYQEEFSKMVEKALTRLAQDKEVSSSQKEEIIKLLRSIEKESRKTDENN